jgi:hypothetical protein
VNQFHTKEERPVVGTPLPDEEEATFLQAHWAQLLSWLPLLDSKTKLLSWLMCSGNFSWDLIQPQSLRVSTTIQKHGRGPCFLNSSVHIWSHFPWFMRQCSFLKDVWYSITYRGGILQYIRPILHMSK